MRWIVDEDGDIGVTFFNIITFVKYKHGTVVRWWTRFPSAPKYVITTPYRHVVRNHNNEAA